MIFEKSAYGTHTYIKLWRHAEGKKNSVNHFCWIRATEEKFFPQTRNTENAEPQWITPLSRYIIVVSTLDRVFQIFITVSVRNRHRFFEKLIFYTRRTAFHGWRKIYRITRCCVRRNVSNGLHSWPYAFYAPNIFFFARLLSALGTNFPFTPYRKKNKNFWSFVLLAYRVQRMTFSQSPHAKLSQKAFLLIYIYI